MQTLNIVKKSTIKRSEAFDVYWKFCHERQSVYLKRVNGEDTPWTNDSIISQYKFTNAYRASDRVSQYLIKNVIYEGSQDNEEVIFRTLLFKIFNKIETWEFLKTKLNSIEYKSFNVKNYNKLLTALYNSNQTVYSAAYIMPSGGKFNTFSHKHEMHLNLLQHMMKDGVTSKLESSKSMQNAYDILVSYPTIGPFLGYQYATDINYSNVTDFNEMEFVVAGPGALDGIKKCFTSIGDYGTSDIIRYMCDTAAENFERLGLKFQDLWGRPLQLIDCQNVFCEVSKYTRVSHPEIMGTTGRMRIKQNFNPSGSLKAPWFPPKWKINGRISQ